MGQVNGEADLAEPEEDAGGKKLPEGGGDEDSNDAGIHAEGRVAFGQEAAWWEDAVDLVQLGGPTNRLGLVGRVGGDEQADYDQDGREKVSDPTAGHEKALDRRVVGHVGEEHTEEELLAKGFYTCCQSPITVQGPIQKSVYIPHSGAGF